MQLNSILWVFVSVSELYYLCTILAGALLEATCCLCVSLYIPRFNWQIKLCISLLIIFLFLAGQQLWTGEASARFNVQTKHPKVDPDLSNSVSWGYRYFCSNWYTKGSWDACASHGRCLFHSLLEWNTKDIAHSDSTFGLDRRWRDLCNHKSKGWNGQLSWRSWTI
jgi:hypothetical protein